MWACSKLLLLLLSLLVLDSNALGSYYTYDAIYDEYKAMADWDRSFPRGPCSMKDDELMKTGTWKKGHGSMISLVFSDLFMGAYEARHYSHENLYVAVDENKEVAVYHNPNEDKTCYRADIYCGFVRHEGHEIKFKTFMECDRNSDCKTRDGERDYNLRCTVGVCCPTKVKLTNFIDTPRQLLYEKSDDFYEFAKDAVCNEGMNCYGGLFPCVNVLDDRFYRYADMPKKNAYRCVVYRTPDDACPFGNKPKLNNNKGIAEFALRNTKCPAGSVPYTPPSKRYAEYYCCPMLYAHFGRSDLYHVEYKPDESFESPCDSDCGKENFYDVCVPVSQYKKDLLFKEDNNNNKKKACVRAPYCPNKDKPESHIYPFNIDNGGYTGYCTERNLDLCGANSYCAKGNLCCPLDCPYIRNEAGTHARKGGHFYEVPSSGLCKEPASSLTYSGVLGRKICCYVDDEYLAISQAPALTEKRTATTELSVHTEIVFRQIIHADGDRDLIPLPYYTHYSTEYEDLIGYILKNGPCAETKDCIKEQIYPSFCGLSQFHDEVGGLQHVLGSPRRCFRTPSLPAEIKVQLMPTIGLRFCKTNNDCEDTGYPVDCVEDKKSKKGKMCHQSECFGVGGINPKSNCKDYTDCKSNKAEKNYDCFKTAIGKKHCCGTWIEECPGGVHFVPAKDGSRHPLTSSDCEATNWRATPSGGKPHCCPKLRHNMFGAKSVNYHIDLEPNGYKAWKTYGKKCKTYSDCDEATEFCGKSERWDGRPLHEEMYHCYKRPMCSGNYISSLHLREDVAKKCDTLGDCAYYRTSVPRYCDKSVGLCCMVEKEMCPYWTEQTALHSISNLDKCDDICEYEGEQCTDIPRIGKRCCYTNENIRCPHNQPPALVNFKKADVHKCSTYHLYKYTTEAKIDVCCRHFQYAGITEYLEPLQNDKAAPGQWGQEVVCKKHSDCRKNEFCGKAGYYKREPHLSVEPLPKVYLCFPLPKHEGIMAMRDEKENVGVLFCDSPKKCAGANDAVACERGKVGKAGQEETTKEKMCFEKKCPFGMKSLQPTTSCTSNSDCSKNSVCTPIGVSKHCCPISNAEWCYENHLPVPITSKGCSNEISVEPYPNPSYTSVCCPRYELKAFGLKGQRLYTHKSKSSCDKQSQCSGQEFCGFSTISGGIMKKTMKHCYKRPVYEGVTASSQSDQDGVQTCKKAEDCKATNPVVCAQGQIDGLVVEGLKFCFEMPCAFGEKPSNPAKTCKTSSDCGKEVCVKTFSSTSHCCRTGSNDIKCPTDQPPVMGSGNDPHGKCDSTARQVAIKNKNYCCPILTYKLPKGVQETYNSPPCLRESDCNKRQFCGESSRKDNQPMLKSVKHCYPLPSCSNSAKFMLFNDDVPKVCTSNIECLSEGQDPYSCTPTNLCCQFTECPYWTKMVKGNPAPWTNSKCEGKTLATMDRAQSNVLCCPVDEDKMCPGDQLPVMVDKKVPTTCPSETAKHPSHSNICCRSFQSKDVKIKNEPARPQDEAKTCASHKECSEDEFCGYSEFVTEKETLLGTPTHCYKTPSFNGLFATRERSVGILKCSKASDCSGASQPVICEQVDGEGFCFEKSCPFGAPAKNAEATCTDHKSCGADSLCTAVHKSSKHCCLVSNEFRCHNLQVPYMLAESGKCKDESVLHRKNPVCCQPFIYKHLSHIHSLSPVKEKECITHSDCDPTQFCGESTLSKMENRVSGSPKHCYNRPQNNDKVYATASPATNVMTCDSDNVCKTSHPSVCEAASINGKAINGINMCFEKKCPFGGVAPTTLKNCDSDSECSSGTLCTNVIGPKKHCCPVSDKFKCYGRQVPYIKPGSKGCEDLSVAYNSLCCQKFIFKNFGESTPLFAANNDNECSVHNDCKEGEFCGESELYKMPGKAVGSPKHCYKKPGYEKGLAIADTQLGLMSCQEDVDCTSSHPVVCETLEIEKKAVTGSKYCVEKSCNGGTTQKPHYNCKSHMECAKDGALCEAVFGTKKYCCQPGKERRCYGNQLPYVKGDQVDGVSKCEDGSIPLNGVCCQRFISKMFGTENPLYTRNNEQECTSHSQCNDDEFCGYSTLEHMEGLVIGSPQHCFKAPTLGEAKPILKQSVGIVTCTDVSECSSVATDAVICESAEKNDKVKFCFEKQCPYGKPTNDYVKTCSSDTECNSAICTAVVGKVKHCCPVENSLKCFNTQLPYHMGFSCGEGIDHPDKEKKLCCRKFINKVLGDENAVFPANQEKECKSNADCSSDHFCAQSTVQNANALLQGNPKHCYPRPVFDSATPIIDANGLKSCNVAKDCKTMNPSVCAGGKISGKEIKGVNICYEKPCPFGALSTSSVQCETASDCTNSVCYNVFSSVKHCCPSGSDFACHMDQDPYVKAGAKGCEDGSFVHPLKPDLCCQKFTYKLFNEAPVFEPMTLTSCTSQDNCKDNEFCGESMLQKMNTKNKPKHCYPLPMLNGKRAMTDSLGELITCKDASTCPGSAVATCSAPKLPSGELSGISICYEAKCPLWDKTVDRSLIKDCAEQSECGAFGSTHCVNLFGQKNCCPVDEKFLCPGGVPAVLDKDDYALEVCNSDQHFEKKVDGESYCCDTPVSAGYVDAAGIDIESKDGQNACKTNSDCDKGYFCGASVSKADHKAFGNGLMHCYQEPTGAGGIRRKNDGNGITLCDSHEKCKQEEGEYCNRELGKQYAKGICHLAKCPLAKALTENYITCTTNTECGKEQCHPITEKERGCCTVDDGNFCPGGLLPATVGEKSCAKEHFSFKANGVNVCCRRVISETLKAAGSEWPVSLSGSDQDLISAMDHKGCNCNSGFFCDKSAALDGSILEKELKLCYPAPKTHGIAVSGLPGEIKTCKDSSDCDTAKGQICDLKIHEIEKILREGTGICSNFFCPLSPASPVSPGSEFKSGHLNLCSSVKKCGADKECQPVGKGEKYQACCGVDDEFVCPGGILPRKYKNKMFYDSHITCDGINLFSYKFGTHMSNPADEARCCPIVISRDIYMGSYEGEKRDKVYPNKQEETCQKHEDCKNDEFCGESMLAENFDTGEELVIKGAKVHHCYKKPKCSGKTVLQGIVGLKVCTASATDACGDNEVCDFNLGDFNNNEFRNTGVCCHFNCKGSYIESKEAGPWKAGKICEKCDGVTEDQAFCDSEAKGDEHSIKVCEKTDVGNYRLCTYERDPVTCGADLPVRTTGGFDLLGCEHDIDCRIQRKDISPEVRPRCAAPSRALPGFAKICCQADLCSDFFTVRKDQNECKSDKECSIEIGAYKKEAICEQDFLGKDETKHCCPYAESSDDIDPDVAHPFRINKNCSSLSDCIGYRRFCDPVTSQCMYNGRYPRQPMPLKTCAKTDKDCGDPREICMTRLEENTDAEPECFYHPLDTCITNKDCLDGYYCAPPVGTTEEEYNTAFRQCHKNPKSVVTDPDYFGLYQCKTSADCKDPTKDICDSSMEKLAVKPGFGFCKLKEDIVCRGNPLLTYAKGKLLTCTKNADCDGNTHFCDMDMKTTKGWAKGKGVCCSKPTDVAGDLPIIDVGLKICKNDDGCDAQKGEICDKNIQKPEGSSWNGDEGVCAKMNCPATTNPEVVVEEATPAGPMCEIDNCQSDADTIKSCVPTPNKATKLRCCSYKRKPSVCPADTKGPVRSGFDALRCTASTDCPSGAACFDGWCCKQDLCSDGFTMKMQQPICSEATVGDDCKQPTGASASCEDGHCCPISTDGAIEKPYVTQTECESLADCPVHKMYCHDELKKCVHFGNRPDLETKTPCAAGNNTCPNQHELPGVCVLPSDAPGTVPLCFADPMAKKAPKAEALQATKEKVEEPEEKSSTGMIIGIVAAVVAVIAIAGIGGFVFFKYRQHKKNKAKGEEPKAKDTKKDTKKNDKKPAAPSKKYQTVSEVSMVSEVSQGSQVEQPSVKEENSKLESDRPPNPNAPPLAPKLIAM